MRRSIVLLIVVAVVAVVGWAVWLTVNVANGHSSQPASDLNQNPVNSNEQATRFNACNSEDQEQVTQLVENGQAVNRAWMFLDKNESEVAAGDLWTIEIPTGVYGQVFVPTTGMTYEVRGPGHVRVGAATFWCDDIGDSSHHGQMRALNATRLPEPIGDWVNINLP